MTNSIPQRHDALTKSFLSDLSVAREFLELHLSAEIKDACDLSALQIEPTSYVDDDLKMHCSDITYKLELKNKTNFLYIYTLIEHQNKSDELMPFRVLKYQVAIIQNHLKKHRVKGKKELKLPLVASLVFYNGIKSPYPYKTDIADIFEDRDLFNKIQLGKFKLIDLTIVDNDEILKHGKVAVLEMLAKHIYVRDFKAVINYLISALVAGYNNHLSDSLFGVAFTYLSTVREPKELLELSDEIIKNIPNYKEMVMTYADSLIQKGRQEGRQEAEMEIAKKLLNSGIDISAIKCATHLSDKELEQLKASCNN